MLDADTYCQSSLDDLFKETKYNIMLMDIQHRLTIPNYKKTYEEYQKFTSNTDYPTNYGGEFWAGNKELLKIYIDKAESVYHKIIDSNFVQNFGDEFITCIVANEMRDKIKNANAYIFRFWTARSFYLISTNYVYNPISILHLPCEKNRAMLVLFKYYIKNNKFPEQKKIISLLCLPDCSSKLFKIKNLIKKKFLI